MGATRQGSLPGAFGRLSRHHYSAARSSSEANALTDRRHRDASSSFWSPDGVAIGFVADRRLKTVNLANGSVQILADLSQTTCAAGGARSTGGTIVVRRPHGEVVIRIH